MDWNELIFTRQSCRSYQDKQISDSQLGQLLQAACCAPVGHRRYENVQLTVVQSKEKLKQISETALQLLPDAKGDPLYGAPTVILVSVREEEGQIAPVSIANAACIMENMHLAATNLGLGSCYLWSSTQTISQNFELLYSLELQDGFWPVSALAVGYPELPLTARSVPLTRIRTNYIED